MAVRGSAPPSSAAEPPLHGRAQSSWCSEEDRGLGRAGDVQPAPLTAQRSVLYITSPAQSPRVQAHLQKMGGLVTTEAAQPLLGGQGTTDAMACGLLAKQHLQGRLGNHCGCADSAGQDSTPLLHQERQIIEHSMARALKGSHYQGFQPCVRRMLASSN